MEDFDHEGVVFRYEDGEKLADIVEELAPRRAHFLNEAAQRARGFRRANSPRAYVTALDRRAREAEPASNRKTAPSIPRQG